MLFRTCLFPAFLLQLVLSGMPGPFTWLKHFPFLTQITPALPYSPIHFLLSASCPDWGNIIENKISSQPRKSPHKSSENKKQFYYRISIKSGSDVCHRQSLRNFRKKSHPFSSQVDINHYMHVFEVNNNQSINKRARQYHLSHIVHPNFTLLLEWPSGLANWLYPEEKQISHKFMPGGSFATWSKGPT